MDSLPKWSRKIPSTRLYSRPDDYYLRLQIGAKGRLSITVTSPAYKEKSEDVDATAGSPDGTAMLAATAHASREIRMMFSGGVASDDQPELLEEPHEPTTAHHNWTYTTSDSEAAAASFFTASEGLPDLGWTVEPLDRERAIAAATAGGGRTREEVEAILDASDTVHLRDDERRLRGNIQYNHADHTIYVKLVLA
ncbi:hypothetical protein BIV57_22545 [Mangrovactinospora gilvigrisea]|uniref:Uncharacterized protein n=1 Tax=Mangrovactinospora gilvigrisea TaxID=1428644 RepID=A0A1J7C6K7_9ACTN|nr:hypothetical protein [Mangrovactinospora gilvigrisea]OIV35258.1 hypothetical protein BIV57_22545 [Mangrovactinospora gilvigrisea]